MLTRRRLLPDLYLSSHCKVEFTACLRAHLHVVLRKLIRKLQAFSQWIQETSMVRFYSSIYADDELLIRQMSCDSAFHGVPHQIAAAHRLKTECLGSVPECLDSNLIRVANVKSTAGTVRRSILSLRKRASTTVYSLP